MGKHKTRGIRNYNAICWSDYFVYDETSPSCLRWVTDSPGGLKKAGDIAGTQIYQTYYKKPYAWFVGRIEKQMWSVHRIIYWLHYGDFDCSKVIDHINRNPFDNRIENLRLVSICDNSRNLSKSYKNKTGIAGVFETSLSWLVTWSENRKGYWLRVYFKDYESKEAAFDVAVKLRLEKLEYLRSKGYNYSQEHGT